MAEIKVLFYDGEIVETDEHIGFPPAVAECDDIPTLHEAANFAVLAVYERLHVATSITVDDLFLFGVTLVRDDTIKFIHTPAGDAFFDEHYPGWRHGLAWPISMN
jgi:hypothetical protein